MRFPLLSLFLLFPATSVAAVKPAAAERSASARLVVCDDAARSATFQGDMRTFGRTKELALRFTLQSRDAANPVWARVDAPTFDTWLAAAPDKQRYVYDKAVQNLPIGADYRAIVRFRWRSAKGKVLGRAVKRTRACRQPDGRANLRPVKVGVSAGSEESTRFYSVRVVNDGESDAPPFATRLDLVGAAPPEESTGEPLPRGEEELFEFEAPICRAGSTLTATVDTGAAVDEADEMDNVLSVPCPTARGTS